MLISNSFYGKCCTHLKKLCGKDLFSCVKPTILFWREMFFFFQAFNYFLSSLDFPRIFLSHSVLHMEKNSPGKCFWESYYFSFFKQNLLVKSLWGQINYPVCCFSWKFSFGKNKNFLEKQNFYGEKNCWGRKKKILEIIFETKNWAGKKLLKKKMLVKKQKKFLARKKNSG